ncbi:L-threonate dehydrogenase [Salinicola acroporae]|uniref:L-threonate dehydrogenase n=1 Tax=Salinicola acroporae TaxID=1541440 RepID=A0ABT6I1C5_9GAMM|nr:L-threonate dehydrogenase [Salinicola acroporae]MDH4571273.1 3-hydroxyisobutyrate dehydrogenase [Salinicola acroporae]
MSTTQRPRVGVIGLGSMGMGMATSLVNAGFETWGCDLREEARASFAEAGGHAVATPAEMAAGVEIVLTVVVNADQTRAVLFGDGGLLPGLAPDSVVISCATCAPDDVQALGVDLAAQDIHLLDAPISGGSVKAAAGQLTIMASGPATLFERAENVLDALAAKVFRLGDGLGQGSQVKLVNQLLAGVHIAAAAEAMAYGIRGGCDPQTLYEVITQSAGNSWMFENRVPHILAGDYTPHSAVDIFVKDLGIVHDTAHRDRFPLPLTALALSQFTLASAQGLGREDDIAVVKVYPGITLPGMAANDAGFDGGPNDHGGA